MNISEFKSGVWQTQYQYKSFLPEKINREWVITNPAINTLLSEADRCIGELNAYSQLIPDVDFFITMHITKEATTSSRIEGTQTNIEEALIKEEDITPERRNDWQEVQNYIKAMNYSIGQLEKLPISTRLIKATHSVLLQGVRGAQKLPGEYRNSQNWIGATLKDAVYIPPHHREIPDLMSDLEYFVNNEEINVPHLIKIAIIHYQFETIHPFLDGNGRMGRLLITLYLVSMDLIKKPSLYLSDFFEKNRTFYYDYLNRVRTHNDMIQWITFFLAGIVETAKNSINTFKAIIALRDSVEKEKLILLGKRAENGHKLIKALYQNPITDTQKVTETLNIHPSTANRLMNDFEKLGILKEITGYKRNRMFVFNEYLQLFMK